MKFSKKIIRGLISAAVLFFAVTAGIAWTQDASAASISLRKHGCYWSGSEFIMPLYVTDGTLWGRARMQVTGNTSSGGSTNARNYSSGTTVNLIVEMAYKVLNGPTYYYKAFDITGCKVVRFLPDPTNMDTIDPITAGNEMMMFASENSDAITGYKVTAYTGVVLADYSTWKSSTNPNMSFYSRCLMEVQVIAGQGSEPDIYMPVTCRNGSLTISTSPLL